MDEVADRSVHLIVTSPPYWQLKDYGHENQIGFNDSYEEYVNSLNLVWSECYRVLHPGCRLCINIGDQFARSVYYGRYKAIPIRTEIIKFCESIGFDYTGEIIWQKVTTMNTTGGATVMGSYAYPRNGIVKLDYEFILLFKKLGTAPRPTKGQKDKSRLTREEWNEYFTGHWYFPGEKQRDHLAMFPEELPRRLIKMFSFMGETVLDPFLGSGTTSLASLHLGRNSIGYEIIPSYSPLIRSKLGVEDTRTSTVDYTVELFEQTSGKIDLAEDIRKLPYIFRDPVRFSKKVDPRTMRFGSRVDGKEPADPEIQTVKNVISPECVELSNGQRIRLMGVKTIPEKADAAVRFLNEITRNQKVFVKFDGPRYKDDRTSLGYLFLKNKTFVNAHLVKRGLTDVDKVSEYRWKDRFLKYSSLNHARKEHRRSSAQPDN